ncbi:MAG: PKD domain-containing protein, partial [Bacteroidota bacterium]
KQVYAYGMVDGNQPTRFVGLWRSEFDPTPADGHTYFTSWDKIEHPTYPYPMGHTQLVVSPDSVHGVKSETSDYYGSINPYTRATWISDFWVSPNNPQRLLTLREKFWGSDDGGLSWRQRPSYGGSNWADNRYITMNIAKDTVYWCNDGGLWCAAEADLFPTEAMVAASGLSKGAYMNSKVVPKNGDICVTEGSEMDVSQINKDVIMTGGQDIGQVFTRNGRDAHVASADVYRGRMKPTNDSLFHTGGLYVKVDGGSETRKVYNNINADYHNADRMYGFTNNNPVQLVRSPAGVDAWLVNSFKGEGQANAGGHGWTPVHNQWETFTTSSGIAEYKPGTFEQSRANAEIAFLGDEVGRRLFMTNNLSQAQPTWTQLPNAPAATRYRIATHQYNENLIVLATGAGVYISKNKGQTWSKRGSIPAGSPSIVLLDKNRTEGIYVMTSMTVYYIDETMTEWIEFNEGQPLHQNRDMRIAYYPNGDHRLYVGKYGSGVWGSPLYSVLKENGDRPVVDFRIHGNSKNVIYTGETVQLIDLSMNETTLAWRVENGGEVHVAGNDPFPNFTLNATGFYKVTLTATNANGSITEVKENYIEVLAPPVPLNCTPTNDGAVSWFERMRRFEVNGTRFNLPGNNHYYTSSYIFNIPSGQEATFYGIDIYQTGWNL